MKSSMLTAWINKTSIDKRWKKFVKVKLKRIMQTEIVDILFDIHFVHHGYEWKISKIEFRRMIGNLKRILVFIIFVEFIHFFLKIGNRIIDTFGFPSFNRSKWFIGAMSTTMLLRGVITFNDGKIGTTFKSRFFKENLTKDKCWW